MIIRPASYGIGHSQSSAIRAIAESVARLAPPALGPLRLTFLDALASVEEERARLYRECDVVAAEGYDAAAGLALSLIEGQAASPLPHKSEGVEP
jgi:hypothetical protein